MEDMTDGLSLDQKPVPNACTRLDSTKCIQELAGSIKTGVCFKSGTYCETADG